MSYEPNAQYCSIPIPFLKRFLYKFFRKEINYPCYLHDRQYRNEVIVRKTRLEADEELRDRIYDRFDNKFLGLLISKSFFWFVRSACWMFWVKQK